MSRSCEWCGKEMGTARKFARVFVLPKAHDERKLYFHERCLPLFQRSNPRIMMQKEQEATQRNYEAKGLVEYVEQADQGRPQKLSPESLEHLARTSEWRPSFDQDLGELEPRIFRKPFEPGAGCDGI